MRVDRTFAKAALALVLLAPTALSAAEAYPSRPIRFLVPSPPGGSPDILARILASRISLRFRASRGSRT